MIPLDVTIFADASRCTKTGASGWGAWIKATGRDTIVTGSRMREVTATVVQAELAAIANALAVGAKAGIIYGRVMVQSDCLGALAAIITHMPHVKDRPFGLDGVKVIPVKKWKAKHEHLRPALEAIQKMLADNGTILTVRHVRGHQAGQGRSGVNRMCDAEAKRHMRFMRRELLKDAAP